MILFAGALYFQSAHCRDWWYKWGDDWVSGSRCLDACLCCLVYSHWICLSEKFASYFESCSFTFFVSLQEEETPLSAGLLSLHVHGTVCISSWHRDNHEKDKLSETFDQKFCPPPQTLFRHSKTLRDTILWLSHPPQTLLEQTLLKFPPSQTLLELTFLRFLTLVSLIGTQLADSLARFQSRFQKHYNHLH